MQGKKLEMHNMNKHMSTHPNLFSSLTATLLNLLLFGAPENNWEVMRPILSPRMVSEYSFNAYKDHLLSTQTLENQFLLSKAFGKLLADVNHIMDRANRDRFTQKLTAFHIVTRSFLTL